MSLRLSAFVLVCLLLCAGSGCDFDSSGVNSSCQGEDCTRTSPSKREKQATWAPTRPPSETHGGDAALSDAAGPERPPRKATQSTAKASKPAANSDEELDAGKPEPTGDTCGSRKEVCNTIDDDCDDKVDEDCECPGDKPVACYDGPSSTRSVGSCHSGSRTCKDGVLGECVGSVLPRVETCNGMDDDCNGAVDDAPGLDSDLENCGRCGNACAAGESCCAGRCVNPATGNDLEHCGACGKKCTMGALPGCCRGNCVDLLTDGTCGTCDNACGIFKLGAGFVCTCKLLESGPGCAARSNTDEWMLCR